MPLNKFQLISLILNVIQVFTVYKYLRVFFSQRRTKVFTMAISFFMYYIVMGTIALYYNVPFANLIMSLLSFYLLSLNYKGTIKRRLMASVCMYVTMTCIELVVTVLSGYFDLNNIFSVHEYSSITGNLAYKLLCMIAVLLADNYSNIKKGVEIPTSSWLSVFFIPAGTFYIIINLLILCSDQNILLVNSMLILLGINIITFYLYDALTAYFEEKLDKLLLKQQNESYIKQLEMMNSSYENVRTVRHDIKNHLIALETFIKRNNKEKAIEYISQIIDLSYGDKDFVSSGNMDIDSILNYKIEQAKSKNIEVQIDVNIPTELNIATLDVISILGNLIDNAINACNKLDSERKILLSLKYSRGIFFITISNTFDGKIIYKSDKIVTTNRDKDNHGIGLVNINNIIDKYNGTIRISHLENIFKVSILLYLT